MAVISRRHFYPNAGSGNSFGNSMDISMPSGTLYDSSWLDKYIAGPSEGFGTNSNFSNGVNGPMSRGGETYENGAIGMGDFGPSSGGAYFDSFRGNQNEFSKIDMGLRDRISLGFGVSLTISQSATSDFPGLGLSWGFVSVNSNGLKFTTPSPGVSVAVGVQYSGLLDVGFNFGLVFLKFSFDLMAIERGLEGWYREAKSQIYMGYNFGDERFNMNQPEVKFQMYMGHNFGDECFNMSQLP